MRVPDVVVHADADLLAAAVSARLVTALVDAQTARGEAAVVLTGGGLAGRIYAALAHAPARDAVDWTRVSVWWGDERFLPAGDQERNETLARQELLDALPLCPRRVHAMPAAAEDPSDGELARAAARYAGQLWAASGKPGRELPAFDVVLLGVGEDGHVASLFPRGDAVRAAEPVAAVRDAPKPPPLRLSLTLPALRRGREVWLCVAGADKADAVARGLSGAPAEEVPAAAVRGRERTRWLVDRASAARLPRGLPR